MPYVTRKIVQTLYKKPLVLKVNIADDVLPKHYILDTGITTLLRGTVSLLVDENFYVKRVIDHHVYDFQIFSKGFYGENNKVFYDRYLRLPEDLVKGFALDEGMGIEIILNEVVRLEVFEECIVEDESEAIFPNVLIKGSMDFEPKGPSGEIPDTSELLILKKFDDCFFDKLVLEINNAFRLGLFTATIVLIRKLFENLIIDVLRQRYGIPEIELFYSKKDNGFHSLSMLISNLRTKIPDFRPYGFFKLDRDKESFLNFLQDIRHEGNASAHSLGSLLGRDEINTLKPSINKYSELFVHLIHKIKETPN